MDTSKRKHSPRTPSLSLDEAIARTDKIYKMEGKHPAAVEVVLRHIGYTTTSGSANRALASLRYWGLVDRPADGKIVVSSDFEIYKFTPDEDHRQAMLVGFLKRPQIIGDLLEKYGDRLPSDGSIKYDLIQMGFAADAAEACLTVFKKSIEFAKYYEFLARSKSSEPVAVSENEDQPALSANDRPEVPNLKDLIKVTQLGGFSPATDDALMTTQNGMDRIPIRLAGNRKAWLEIPTPLFKADLDRLKRHIDLLLTDDEDDELA